MAHMNEDATKKPISPSINLTQKACPRTRSSEKRDGLGMLGESNLHVAEGYAFNERNKKEPPKARQAPPWRALETRTENLNAMRGREQFET